jgi:hypothetical protein
MLKLHHRKRGFVFAVLIITLSVTTVLWSTNITTNVSLLESTAMATNPDDDRQDTNPGKIRQQQHAPKEYNNNIYQKRPWNQPDLTFTLKNSAVDGRSSSSSTRPERSRNPRSQNALNRKFEGKKEENKDEDAKVENEDEHQNEQNKDDTKEETQRTRAKKKARTKTKKRKTMRKKKRKFER